MAESKVCTPDMIQGSCTYKVQQVLERCVGQKKDLKMPVHFVCNDIYLPEPGMNIADCEQVQLTFDCMEELMICYVHRADGKKRV